MMGSTLNAPEAYAAAAAFLAPLDRIRERLLAVPLDVVELERQRLAPPFDGERVLCRAPSLILAVNAVMRAQEPVAKRALRPGMPVGEMMATHRARHLSNLLQVLGVYMLVDECARNNVAPELMNLRRSDPADAVIVESPPPANIILPGSMARGNGSAVRRPRG